MNTSCGPISLSTDNSITFTPTTGIAYSSSIRIYAYGAGSGYDITNTFELNGGSPVTFAGDAGTNSFIWVDVASGSGTLTSLKVRLQRPGTSYVRWAAIEIDGTILKTNGVNGYHLNFSDNSNTTAATLGKDSSGNGNNWTPNNLSVATGIGNDSVEDTPTNNFCTLNTLGSGIDGSGCDISQGGLYVARNSGSNRFMDSTFTLSSGKWYWEAKTGSSISDYPRIGIWNRGGYQNRLNYPGEGNENVASDDHVRGWGANGTSFGASGDSASGLPTFSTDDVLMFALDMDNGKIWFGKNGTWYTDDNSTTTTAAAIAAGTATQKFADLKSGAETQFRQSEKAWTPIFHMNSGDKWYVNFGQKAFTHASAVPSGFKSMCTKNLPEPAIIKPTDYYGTIMYTGNDYNGTRAITGLDFAPDFIWNKCHTHASANNCWDTVRTLAALKDLRPDGDQAEGGEQSDKYGYITALSYTNPGTGGYNHVTGSEGGGNSGSDGNAAMNVNGRGYVSWCWKKSVTAGFDIVTYTGDGSDGTSINHALGVKPDLISVKRRDGTSAWVTECPHTHNGRGMHWNLDNGSWTAGTNTITLNTSNFTFANSGDSNRKVNFNGETYVAYLWASIPGFSKIYGYSGNGNADGEFIYTGFRPAYVVYKATDEAYWWIIHDTGRDPDNVVKRRSWINVSNAENNSGAYADFYANGIKFRTSDAGNNSTNINHIVIAFAAQTLKYANAH